MSILVLISQERNQGKKMQSSWLHSCGLTWHHFCLSFWPQALSLGYFSSWVHLNYTLRTLPAYSGGRFSAVGNLSYVLPRGNTGGKCKWNPWLVCNWWLGQEILFITELQIHGKIRPSKSIFRRNMFCCSYWTSKWWFFIVRDSACLLSCLCPPSPPCSSFVCLSDLGLWLAKEQSYCYPKHISMNMIPQVP